MPVYSIAGLPVFMEPKGSTLLKQSEKYLAQRQVDKEACAIQIDLETKEFKEWLKTCDHSTYGTAEYHWAGYQFFLQMQKYDGFFFHASAVSLDHRAYLFSAPKGMGKSTHTKQWVKYWGGDRAVILNDDKPVIRRIENTFMACGNPFSGKTDTSASLMVPVQGICFLEQGEDNHLFPIAPKEAISLFFAQTMLQQDALFMDSLLLFADRLIQQVPLYRMRCNISAEAVKTAYEGMRPKTIAERNALI